MVCQKVMSDEGESKAGMSGSAGSGVQLEKGRLGKALPCVFEQRPE